MRCINSIKEPISMSFQELSRLLRTGNYGYHSLVGLLGDGADSMAHNNNARDPHQSF